MNKNLCKGKKKKIPQKIEKHKRKKMLCCVHGKGTKKKKHKQTSEMRIKNSKQNVVVWPLISTI